MRRGVISIVHRLRCATCSTCEEIETPLRSSALAHFNKHGWQFQPELNWQCLACVVSKRTERYKS